MRRFPTELSAWCGIFLLVVFSNHPCSAGQVRPVGSDQPFPSQSSKTSHNPCSVHCPKPWSPPDRWFDANSNGVFDPDGGDYYDPVLTGYGPQDYGTQIGLVLGNGSNASFGQYWYYAVDYPPINDGNPISGADQYVEWITGDCPDSSVAIDVGDLLGLEPGSMVGPNGAGLYELFSLDPFAEWDLAEGQVIHSDYDVSPRIVRVVLFDPSLGVRYGVSGRYYVTVVKTMTLFIEQVVGNTQISGRIIETQLDDPDADGVISGCDNCAQISNPDQADADKDGVGDVCDDCTCAAQADFDGDGFRTTLDVGSLIDVLYTDGTDIQDPTCPNARGDLDCDGFCTSLDLSQMIDHVFAGGPAPCTPCE